MSSIDSLRIRRKLTLSNSNIYLPSVVPRPRIIITSSSEGQSAIRRNAHLMCNVTAQDVHKTSFASLHWERRGQNIKSETLLPLIEDTRLFSYKFDHVSQLSLPNQKLSYSGQYSCSVELIPSDATPFLLPSDTETNWIMLNIIGKHNLCTYVLYLLLKIGFVFSSRS